MSEYISTEEAERIAEPHRFRPIRLWDIRSNGRCIRCYVPMSAHPIHCRVRARPIGDRTPARLSFETLHVSESQP